MLGKIYVASVVSVKDVHAGGMIKVVNTSINGGNAIVCYASSPTGGGGSGFFSVPGKHSNVLITQAEISGDSRIWVWLASVYLPTNNAIGVDGTPLDTDDAHVSRGETGGYGNRPAGDNSPYYSHDNPEHVDVYQDNFLPEGEIWKSRGGHSFSMYTKNTSERSKNGITVRSANGKVLLLDDSSEKSVNGHTPRKFPSLVDPSKDEPSKGNRVILMHEDGNRVQITGDAAELVSYGAARLRAKSKIDISIESPTARADIDIVNNGTGNINLESNGDVSIKAGIGFVNIDTNIPGVPILVDEIPFIINTGVLINGSPIVTFPGGV